MLLPPLPPDRCALGVVEGWRGEILYWVRTGAGNRIERCKVKDPSLEQLAGPGGSRAGQHRAGLPGHQQELQPLLFRNGSLTHVQDPQKDLRHRAGHDRLPRRARRRSPTVSVARRRFDFATWRDAQPAAEACPTGALSVVDSAAFRQVTLDYGLCIFCGECAEADRSGSVQMTSDFDAGHSGPGQPGDRRRLRSAFATGVGASSSGLARHPAVASPPRASKSKSGRRSIPCSGGSLAIREVDAGSCNGCEVEITALNNPVYDLERLGIHFVASPRHADMLLVTGPVTRNMELALRKTYNATPDPKVVVAVGACGISGGIFGRNYATVGGVVRLCRWTSSFLVARRVRTPCYPESCWQ